MTRKIIYPRKRVVVLELKKSKKHSHMEHVLSLLSIIQRVRLASAFVLCGTLYQRTKASLRMIYAEYIIVR